jgi:hypothetical protein
MTISPVPRDLIGIPLIETVPAVPVLCVVSVALPDVSQAIARREYASDGDVE